jgi:16S rRNA (cytidine1402-2'-O)-methyltransferase
MPVLYVIATPIGNLEDISLRALRLLREVKLIAAEDTRTTRHLLNTYNIKTPLTSYHEHSKRAKLEYLLDYLEKEDLALVSEAGMPGLSDPGYELIVAAIERGISVIPIPGASAVITALVVSGLPTDQFLYVGFLPRRKETLSDIGEILGDRRISVCRELTKVHEEIFRGRVSQAREHFVEPRGEFSLVIEGKTRAWLKFQERS